MVITASKYLQSDKWQRGLLDGFTRSVYWTAISSEITVQDDYKIVRGQDDLCQLNYGFYNLARLRDNEVDRVKDIHQRLIGNCRNLSIKFESKQLEEELNKTTSSLCKRLEQFASLEVLPGKCSSCPV